MWFDLDGLLHEPVEQLPAGGRTAAVEAEGELVEVVVEMLVLDRPWSVPSSQRFKSEATCARAASPRVRDRRAKRDLLVLAIAGRLEPGSSRASRRYGSSRRVHAP